MFAWNPRQILACNGAKRTVEQATNAPSLYRLRM
jgi:hypothetical protein